LVESPELADHRCEDVTSGLGRIIETMLAKKPGDRYQAISPAMDDLRSVAVGRAPRHVVDASAFESLAQMEAEAPAQLVRVDRQLITRPVLVVLLIISLVLNVILYLLLAAG